MRGRPVFKDFRGIGHYVEQDDVRTAGAKAPPMAVPMSLVEWRMEVVEAGAKLKGSSAPGLDDIPPDFVKCALPRMSMQIAQVAERSAWEGVPFEWRGAKLFPAPRKPSRPLSLANSRAVACPSSFAKVYANILRKRLAAPLKAGAGDLQMGAVKGGSVDFLVHAARAWFARGRCLRKPVGLLFIDIRSAFYSCLPEIAVGRVLTSAVRSGVLGRLGFSGEEVRVFAANFLQYGSWLEGLGLDDQWRAVAQDWVGDNWLQLVGSTRGSTRQLQVLVGTRPGDVPADVIFCLCLLCLQYELLGALEEQGLVAELPVVKGAIFPAAEMHPVQCKVVPFTYMDDLAIPLEAKDCSQLLDSVGKAADSFSVIARSVGLQPDFDAGKTEAAVLLRGPGSRMATRWLASREQGDDRVPTVPIADGTQLRVVRMYKYLGAKLTTPGGLACAQEVAARADSAKAATGAVGSLLARKCLPVKSRMLVAEACIFQSLAGCRVS